MFKFINLSKVAEIKNGFAFKSQDFCDEGIPVVKIKNITPPIISINDIQYVSEEIYENIKQYELNYNDILISMTGSGVNQMSSAVGKVGRVRYKKKSLQNQRVGKIIVKDESRYNLDFLYYYLSMTKTLEYFVMNSTGSANQANISKNIIERLKIPDINILEQKKIANILLSLDNKIENNSAIIANLEEQAQTIFKSWFVDFEPFQDGKFKESELGLIPEIFSVIPFENFVSVSSGKRKKNSEKSEENIYPIIGATKITGYTNDYLFDNKVIITGRVGTLGTFHIYNSRIWPSDNTLILSSDYFGYTYFSLNQINFLSLNRGSTQPLVSQKDIKNYKTVFPDTKWLSKFEEIMNPIFDYYWRLEKENKKLAETRDILLPKLMSGEIRVEETIEVEEM